MLDNSELLTWHCPRCGIQWNTPEDLCLLCGEERPEDEQRCNRFEQMSDVRKDIVWR